MGALLVPGVWPGKLRLPANRVIALVAPIPVSAMVCCGAARAVVLSGSPFRCGFPPRSAVKLTVIVQFCPALKRGGAGVALGVVAAAGDAGEGRRVTAHVGHRYRLGRTGESDLQDAEVQAGSGKRQGQRGIVLARCSRPHNRYGRANAAVRQCPSRPSRVAE